MKRSILLILIIILIVISLFVSCKKEDKSYSPSVLNTNYMHEWISPDGVHYWVYAAGYKGAMSPRYDVNGDLVIDK